MTLSFVVMAAVVLVAFWTAALLISVAMLGQMGEIVRASGILGRGLARYTVEQGSGDGGVFASRSVRQVGRAELGARSPRIVFHDRGHSSRLWGGRLRAALRGGLADPGSQETVEVRGIDRVPVWLSPGLLRARASRVRAEEMAAGVPLSRQGGGLVREIEVPILAGETVWVAWDRPASEDRRPVLVSALDPRFWAARQLAVLALAIVMTLGLAALFTGIAAAYPRQSWQSQTAGALGLVYFLAIQQFAVWIRDRVTPPDRCPVNGAWTTPSPQAH